MRARPLFFCLAILVSAQPPAFTADRGESTMGTDVIGPGALQIEFGALLERGRGGGVLHAPMPLFRAGLTERLELRATEDGPSARTVGIELKYKLCPWLAVASSLTSGRDAAVKLVWRTDLARSMRAVGNLSASREARYGASLALERALTRTLTGYIEHYRDGLQQVWSSGLVQTIGRDMQVDIGAARETTSTRTPWRVTAGWAIQLRPAAR